MSPNLDSSFPWLVNTLWILNCSSVGTRGEESAYQCRRHKTIKFDPWVGKIPWKRKWQSTLIFLPGKSHGHSLAPTPTHKGRGPPHQVIWGGNMTYYSQNAQHCTWHTSTQRKQINYYHLYPHHLYFLTQDTHPGYCIQLQSHFLGHLAASAGHSPDSQALVLAVPQIRNAIFSNISVIIPEKWKLCFLIILNMHLFYRWDRGQSFLEFIITVHHCNRISSAFHI